MEDGPRSLAFVVAAFALIMTALYLGLGSLVDQRQHPNAGLETTAGGPQRIVLRRNPSGQYLVPGTIDDQPVTFLVDTGATHVSIPLAVADRIGLERGPSVRVETAGGTVRAHTTIIDRLALGGLVLTGVRATITPTLGGDQVLLGMTALRHLDIAQRGRQLVLSAPKN